MDWIVKFYTQHKKLTLTIAALFVVTRLIFWGISEVTFREMPDHLREEWKLALEQKWPTLSRLAIWDSEWYLKIADNAYRDAEKFDPQIYSTIGFFPLYPFLMYLGSLLCGNVFFSGVVLANLFLILSAFLLYFVIQGFTDEATAERGVWYLFLFPSAYIFSAVYPESLLLALWLASILAAQKSKWPLVGVFGFLAAMTKPLGILILIPVLIMLFKKKDFKLNVFWISLIPCGLFLTGCIQYIFTRDIFAYSHVQSGAWGHHLSNPISVIFSQLQPNDFYMAFNSFTTLLLLVLLIIGRKKIPWELWIFAFCAVLFVPLNGMNAGMWRYAASIFPLIFLFAVWGKSSLVHQSLVTACAVLQGGLVVFWFLGRAILL